MTSLDKCDIDLTPASHILCYHQIINLRTPNVALIVVLPHNCVHDTLLGRITIFFLVRSFEFRAGSIEGLK